SSKMNMPNFTERSFVLLSINPYAAGEVKPGPAGFTAWSSSQAIRQRRGNLGPVLVSRHYRMVNTGPIPRTIQQRNRDLHLFRQILGHGEGVFDGPAETIISQLRQGNPNRILGWKASVFVDQ